MTKMTQGIRVSASILCASLLLAVCGMSAAQDGYEPKFNNLRFEEDWSGFPEEGTGHFTDPLKKINLTDNAWLSIGGELRLRGESWSDFGFAPANDDEFLLYRTYLHTDWHVGDHFRLFVQGRFSGLTDRDLPGGRRDNLDADYGAFWNTFVQGDFELNDIDVMVRFGRQELQYGKQRLVSPLDWANNRRIFDGALVRLKPADAPWQVDAFVTNPVMIDRDSDNERDEDHIFGGVYFTTTVGDDRTYGIDAYLLTLMSRDDAPADEDIYTLGTRMSGPVYGDFTFELEGAYQFGDFDGLDVQAYMLMGEVTYTFTDAEWKPWITAGLDYSSGDDDPADGDKQTFNQLFPLSHAYHGFIDVVARQNIVDARFSVGAWPIPGKLRARFDFHNFWLEQKNDTLYNAGRGVVRAGGVGEDNVGQEIDLTLLYKLNKRWAFLGGYSHFFAGDFIEDTGPSEDIDFFYAQAKFTF